MGFRSVWKNNRVLIVMGVGLMSVHLGWYHLQSKPYIREYNVTAEQQKGAAGDNVPSAKSST